MQERNTVQKRLISDQLQRLGNHPTVDEVYSAVREQRPSISKATVYRVLRQMANSGDALRVPIAGVAEHFDHRTDPHYHVVCNVCGRVEDVETSSIGNVNWAEVESASGYEITSHTLQFNGICPTCQMAEKKGF